MGGACSKCRNLERDAYRLLMGKREGKRPLERPRHRYEDKIIIGLQEAG